MVAADSYTGISSWRDAVDLVRRRLPTIVTKRKVNFITLHYTYIIGVSLFLSVIIYGIGDIPYIDALFFASGASTQSGLNTIDVNKIKTGQQVCCYIGAMLCNPIVIHGSVVFIRLYWFEKRFADLVRDARLLRKTRSRGRTNTQGLDDDDDLESGVKDRAIKHLRSTARRLTGRGSVGGNNDDINIMDPEKKSDQSSDGSPHENEHEHERDQEQEPPQQPKPRRRHTDDDDELDDIRLPTQMDPEQHITFLENQRHPQDNTTLRIPSPREFDRGGKPETIEERLFPTVTRRSTEPPEMNKVTSTPIGAHLTFNEPDIPRDRPRRDNMPKINTKRTQTTASRMTNSSGQRTFGPAQRSLTIGSLRRANTTGPLPYLDFEATIARNSFFVNLSEDEREQLGGIEYRSLKTLAVILLGYFFGFHLLAIVCLTPWIRYTSFGSIVTNDGQGRVWWGFFTAASAFNDLGFTLTPDSMVSFSGATWPLLSMTFFIIIGNTGFPCMLRFTIWLISCFAPRKSGLWEELQFLLDHPRRCFTLLFPRAATWWLFGILVMLNGIDLFFFVVLDLNDETVTALSGWFKFLDGLFQAASTRTAGFAVVNLADLHPAIQVSYLVMMYISVFPIAISMRRTNVYEEKSLGIYHNYDEAEDGKEPSYVGAHLRKQLSFDLWYVFLGLFIIAIVEGHRLENTNEYAFTLFSVLFEIVSAYGTVGLSLGYPNVNTSFSGQFKVLSKLVIIAMQIRGRHRGLPYGLDRAVLLPSEKLEEKEQAEAQRMVSRRPSMAMSTASSAVDGNISSARFRPETGLTSATESIQHDFGYSPRDRRNTNRSHATFHSAVDSPTSPTHLHGNAAPQRALGAVMYKLTNAEEAIKE